MPILEKTIEQKVVKWAKEHGWLHRKMDGMSAASWPDRLFISPNGVVLWIEFKTPSGKLTLRQETMLQTLERYNQKVQVFRDAALAIEWLKENG